MQSQKTRFCFRPSTHLQIRCGTQDWRASGDKASWLDGLYFSPSVKYEKVGSWQPARPTGIAGCTVRRVGGCAGPAPNMQRRRFHDGPAKRQLIHAKYGLHLGGRISASEPAGWDAIPAIICENSSIMGGVLSSPPAGLDGAGPRRPSPHVPSSGPGRANDRSTCKSRGFVPGHVDETCDAPR